MQAALDIPNPLWHPGNIDQFRGQALPYRRVRPGRRPMCHRLVTASRAWNGAIQPLLGISATSISVRPVAFQLWADRCPTSCFRGARCPSQYTRSAERRETHKPVFASTNPELFAPGPCHNTFKLTQAQSRSHSKSRFD